MLRCASLTKTYRSGGRELTVLNDITFAVEPGGFAAIVGPVRQRQDDAARPARRPRPPHRGHGASRRAGARRARRGRPGPDAGGEDRVRLPVLPAHPHPDRAGERAGAARAPGRGRRRPRRRAAGPRGPAATAAITTRPSSPAASSSGSRSRAPSAPGPRSSSPTSPPATSTPRTGAGIIDLMVELNRDLGTTLVLVTHDLDLAARARRTIRLADGRIVGRHRRVTSLGFVLRMAAREVARVAPAAAAPHRLRGGRRRRPGRDQFLHRQPARLGAAAGPGAARRRPLAGEPPAASPGAPSD